MPLWFPLLQRMTAPLSESWCYNPERLLGVAWENCISHDSKLTWEQSEPVWIRGESWHSDANILISLNLPTCSPSTFEKLFIPLAKPHYWSFLWSAVSLAAGNCSSHWAHSDAGRLQETFQSREQEVSRAASGFSRGIFHWHWKVS